MSEHSIPRDCRLAVATVVQSCSNENGSSTFVS